MDLVDGVVVIRKAIEESQADRAYHLWASIYPHMENPPTFEKFYQPNKLGEKSISKDEIIAKAERIKSAHQRGG
jgi:hypothetical protein